MTDQFDLFDQPPANLALAHSKEQVTQSNAWQPKPGAPQYMAAQELVHFSTFTKLNKWQSTVLWPHMRSLIENMATVKDENLLWFELGYIISAMEIEQLRSRSAAREICEKYGITFNVLQATSGRAG